MLQPNYFIDSKGIEYPYFSYETEDGEGLAMFIHPMFEVKNRVLSLLYKEGANIRGLFGKELLGSDFLITNKSGILELEDNAFLVYRPLNANGSWKRKTTHAKENFECKLILQNSKDYKVQCISSSYTLFFTFNSERGVTSFQDFCLNNDICTYELKSNAGILSPYHLQSMKFE
jgi:hypothetical protein